MGSLHCILLGSAQNGTGNKAPPTQPSGSLTRSRSYQPDIERFQHAYDNTRPLNRRGISAPIGRAHNEKSIAAKASQGGAYVVVPTSTSAVPVPHSSPSAATRPRIRLPSQR